LAFNRKRIGIKRRRERFKIKIIQREESMKNTSVGRIQEILDNVPNSADFERFREMVKFLDENFPAIKTAPKTGAYPPAMGYGSFGEDVTEAVLYETRPISL
jgi:hypothetical protein